MATVSDSIPHLVRTSNDPRQEGLHFVTVSKVHEVNSSVRLIRLQLADGGVSLNEVLAYAAMVISPLLDSLYVSFLLHSYALFRVL